MRTRPAPICRFAARAGSASLRAKSAVEHRASRATAKAATAHLGPTQQVQAFVDFALELFAAHLKIAKEAKPSASEEEARTAPLAGAEVRRACDWNHPRRAADRQGGGAAARALAQVKATLRAQQSYCSAQLENMKTRRVLVRAPRHPVVGLAPRQTP